MKHHSRLIITALAAAAVLSCDEGRLITDAERGPFQVVVLDPTGPDTLVVGEVEQYETAVQIGERVLTSEIITWVITPEGLLAHDSEDHGFEHQVEARAPGVATIIAEASHPDVVEAEKSKAVHVFLRRVSAVAPRQRDTTMTAVGDLILVQARGDGANGAVAENAGLDWTHRGGALHPVTQVDGQDTIRFEAVAAGVDTLIFKQQDGLCTESRCQDTILVRVEPHAAAIDAPETLEFFTLGRTASPAITVRDANGNAIAGAAVTWSLAAPADTAVVAVTGEGTVTARGNGSATVVASSGSAQAEIAVVVRQTIDALSLPESLALTALGAADTVPLTALDSGGTALDRPYERSWTARDPEVATVAGLADGAGRIEAVGAGTTWVVAEAESRLDSVRVDVAQAVATVAVAPEDATLEAIDATVQLDAEVRDANGHPVDIAPEWTSSDPGVATVSTTGLVTAAGNGTADITAAADGVESKATVVVGQVATTLAVTPPDTLRSLGASASLAAEARDANGHTIADAAIAWSIVSETVAGAITLSGAQITAAANGTTELQAEVDGTTETVTAVAHQAVASVAVEPTELAFDALGQSETVSAAVEDAGGAPVSRSFEMSWTSRDAAVATVSESGDGSARVEAVGVGETWVVAEAESRRDSVRVQVEQGVATVVLSPSDATLEAIDATVQLDAEVRDANGHLVSTTPVWSTSNEAVATVSDAGLVTAIGNGTARITATAEGAEGTADIAVEQVAATLEVTPPDTLRALGASASLAAEARDANGHTIADPAITWSIVSETVAGAITLSGAQITAAANGTTELQAEVDGTTETVTAVAHQAVASVAVEPTELAFDALGLEESVAVAVLDPGGTAVSRAVTTAWSSSAESVATVAEAGSGAAMVTSQDNGTARVRVDIEGVADSLEVTVAQVVDSVHVVPAVDTLNALGETLTLAATPLDANQRAVEEEPVSWSTEDTDIVDLDAATGEVVSLATGSATITSTAGGVTGEATILSRQVAATVGLTPAVVTDTLLSGDTFQLSAAPEDSNGAAIPEAPIWASLEAGVATVDGTGLVTARNVEALDSARITATLDPASDTAWVFVEPGTPTSVVLSPQDAQLAAFEATVQLTAEVRNQNGNPMPDETVSWSTTDPSVATVDASGLVTAQGNGTADVTATSDTDGSLTASATITVEQVVTSVELVPESHTFTAHDQVQQFIARGFDANGHYVDAAAFAFTDDLTGFIGITVTSDTTADISAEENGTAELTATENGSGAATATTVEVTQEPAAISVTPVADTIVPEATSQLSAEVADANGNPISGAAVDWRVLSGDAGIATVDGNGLVTGSAVGTARVVANPAGIPTIADTSLITVTHYSLTFDGTDDYAEVTGNPLDLNAHGTWTIELWVRPGANAGDVTLMSKGGDPAGEVSYAVILRDGRPVLVTRQTGGNPATRTSELDIGSALSQDAWTHIAFTYDGGTGELFVDGVSQGTGPMNAPQSVTQSLFLGAYSAAGGFAAGGVDEVRFWSTARTAAEISGSMNEIIAAGGPDLLAYWTLEEGAGNPADQVGGLTATLGAGDAAPDWTADSPLNSP